MRPLEATLLAVNAICLAPAMFPSMRSASVWRFVALLPAVAAAAQILWEGYRWQMLPGYAGALVSVFLLGCSWPILRMLLVGGAFLLAGVCIFTAGYFGPVFALPALTGSYPVGTATFHLVDENRNEPHAPAPQARRELMIQVWYPAQATTGSEFARYVTPGMAGRRKAQLALVQTHSVANAPVSTRGGPFPVVMFSPAIGGTRYQNTFQTEELASHGFVVVGIDHPYTCSNVVFPDGRHIPLSVGYLDFSTPEKERETKELVTREMEVRTADVRFVADTLTHWNSSDPRGRFTGRVDTGSFGIIGHSYGGAVAADICVQDSRFRAGMNLDGWMFGPAETQGVSRPFFFVIDDEPIPTAADLATPDLAQRRLNFRIKLGFDEVDHSLTAHGGYYLSVKGAAHYSYSDVPLYSLIRRYADEGSVDPQFVLNTLNAYTVAFFNRYLYGRPEPILNQPPRQSGITFRAYQQPQGVMSQVRSLQ